MFDIQSERRHVTIKKLTIIQIYKDVKWKIFLPLTRMSNL